MEGDGTWAGICSFCYLGIAASRCFTYLTAHYQIMVLTALIFRAVPRFSGFDQTAKKLLHAFLKVQRDLCSTAEKSQSRKLGLPPPSPAVARSGRAGGDGEKTIRNGEMQGTSHSRSPCTEREAIIPLKVFYMALGLARLGEETMGTGDLRARGFSLMETSSGRRGQ